MISFFLKHIKGYVGMKNFINDQKKLNKFFSDSEEVLYIEDYLRFLKDFLNNFFDVDTMGFYFLNQDCNILFNSEKDDCSYFFNENISFFMKNIMESSKSIVVDDISIFKDDEFLSDFYGNGNKSMMAVPIINNGDFLGVISVFNYEESFYDSSYLYIFELFTNVIKYSLLNKFMAFKMVNTTMNGLIEILETRDLETGAHVKRVAHYSKIIAERLFDKGIINSKDLIKEIFWFAPLHDIGKIGISDSILLKPSRLTESEFEEIKKHVLIGYDLLKSIEKNMHPAIDMNFFKTAEDIILHHHENYDGSGYPNGLRGNDISISGRILAVADTFDALCSERPYKDSFSFEDSLKIIVNERGKQFDPIIIGAFLDSIDEIKKIYSLYHDSDDCYSFSFDRK
ncbi:HD domain-containing phosphohydrolase [Oceanotoga teriensis]|uniref:HD domain-containing phosphohydrolase n=1 Tax=Oceanotoga teriensis TaxID=515440 RepID=UPI00271347E6|nr:HD domain-containing phosphohydrolase [Oceanotoga teriensis]MDO7975930.1 HD domain-containing protein [Oceanotoga teriensis]